MAEGGEEFPASIADAASRIRSGALSAHELVRAVQRRADALDGRLGCFVTRDDAGALAAAGRADRELSAGLDRGPLHGIPLGIKDIIAVEGMPTTGQSPSMRENFHGGRDAEVVVRLRRAGAIVVGKTSTMEYAIGMPDPAHPFPSPRNPYCLERWAGGSSSGSASGLAAGLFLGALGTDTGGSGRLPAAWCGITGLKPTYGALPLDGVIPLGYTHDVVAPMARTAADCRLLYEAMSEPSRLHSRRGSSGSVRIGVPYAVLEEVGCAPGVMALFEDALEVLRGLGAQIVAVDLKYVPEVRAANDVSMAVEGWSYHGPNLRERWEDYGWQARAAIVRGALTTAPDYLQAQRVRRVATDALDELLGRVDIIAAPTHPFSPPKMFELELLGGLLEVNLTSFWNSCGYPAISLPMGFDPDGLPAGLHLGGKAHAEQSLLDIGERFQAETAHHAATPHLGAIHGNS